MHCSSPSSFREETSGLATLATFEWLRGACQTHLMSRMMMAHVRRIFITRSCPHMPDLPLEVIGRVLAHLDSDTNTLAAGSLICRNLQSFSQRLLFRTFHLSLFFSNDLTIYRLSNLISCPRLVSYIRDVDLTIIFRADDRDWLEWIETNSTLLLGALQMLEGTSANIHSLSISSGFEVAFSDPTHLEIGKRVAACIEALAQSSSLHTLKLSFTPIDILRCCGPSLKHLVVSHEREVDEATTQSLWKTMKRTTPIILETFGSRHNLGLPPSKMGIHNYLLDSRSLIEVVGLKHFSIHKISTSLWTDDVQLLKASDQSLESLHIHCIRESRSSKHRKDVTEMVGSNLDRYANSQAL